MALCLKYAQQIISVLPVYGFHRQNSVTFKLQVLFKQEVSETVLRCVRDRHKLDNAIVELNSLKLAENRTFADVARYVLTTLMGLCLTAPARLDPEYKSLFPTSMPATDAEAWLSLLDIFPSHCLLNLNECSQDQNYSKISWQHLANTNHAQQGRGYFLRSIAYTASPT